MSRIRNELLVELPLRSLFEAPTVGGLAAIVMQSQTAAAAENAAPIDRLVEIEALVESKTPTGADVRRA